MAYAGLGAEAKAAHIAGTGQAGYCVCAAGIPAAAALVHYFIRWEPSGCPSVTCFGVYSAVVQAVSHKGRTPRVAFGQLASLQVGGYGRPPVSPALFAHPGLASEGSNNTASFGAGTG